LIVPPRAPDPLADALSRLIADPELRAEFGRFGRARFLSHFTVDRFCKEMGDVFLQAIGQRSGRMELTGRTAESL
jgi:glycosyltransferase involved in cell wall biosynthesis